MKPERSRKRAGDGDEDILTVKSIFCQFYSTISML